MSPDLLRQRRNLIAISAALLIFDFADVQVGKVSLLGTELLIGDVKVLTVCAWLLWLYFLLRYYQYWRAEPQPGIRDSFLKRLDAYARAYTNAQTRRDRAGGMYDDYRLSRTGLTKWAYTLEGYDPVEGEVLDGLTAQIPASRLLGWWCKSAAHVSIQTPHATDHILPFALALAAPIVTVCTKWHLFQELF